MKGTQGNKGVFDYIAILQAQQVLTSDLLFSVLLLGRTSY